MIDDQSKDILNFIFNIKIGILFLIGASVIISAQMYFNFNIYVSYIFMFLLFCLVCGLYILIQKYKNINAKIDDDFNIKINGSEFNYIHEYDDIYFNEDLEYIKIEGRKLNQNIYRCRCKKIHIFYVLIGKLFFNMSLTNKGFLIIEFNYDISSVMFVIVNDFDKFDKVYKNFKSKNTIEA